MLSRLFLLFAIVPFIELYILVKVGGEIGALPTIAMVILTGIIGAWLARTQGISVLSRIQQDLSRGVMPTDALVDGACILVAGMLLLVPGFLTDVFGVLLLLPFVRTFLRKRLGKHFATHYSASGGGFSGTSAGGHFIVYGGSAFSEPEEEPRKTVIIDTQPIEGQRPRLGANPADDERHR